jgi:hypothetical protein
MIVLTVCREAIRRRFNEINWVECIYMGGVFLVAMIAAMIVPSAPGTCTSGYNPLETYLYK